MIIVYYNTNTSTYKVLLFRLYIQKIETPNSQPIITSVPQRGIICCCFYFWYCFKLLFQLFLLLMIVFSSRSLYGIMNICYIYIYIYINNRQTKKMTDFLYLFFTLTSHFFSVLVLVVYYAIVALVLAHLPTPQVSV